MAGNLGKRPSKRGPISKIRLSDGCRRDGVLLAVKRWYDSPEFACHLGNVGYNLSHDSERWNAAKKVIARERVPGGDPGLIYEIVGDPKACLSSLGFNTFESLLAVEPHDVPLEECPRVRGPKLRPRIRAILAANRSGAPVRPPDAAIPHRRRNEFFVDFEYFNNLNVDFEREWPKLDGREMVFMIGVGWATEGSWSFRTFIASAETQEAEQQMLEQFMAFLIDATGAELNDPDRTALYNWHNPEKSESEKAANRQNLSGDHPLRTLPWIDLEKVFLDGPAALPGMLKFGLKEVAKSLGDFDPPFATAWPGNLDDGLKAAVMGWRAYAHPQPIDTPEMEMLKEYLEADCQALWNILRWLRS